MNFKLWLERQMMMFSTRPVELYHGSNTGADNSVLDSFKTRGVLPVAQGHGQGAGFYVWSDKKTAAHHTSAIKSDSITTNARQDGLPMIVTVEAVADPDRWDMDYETNKGPIIDWLHDNFDRFSQMLSDDDLTLRAKYNREVLDPKDRMVMSKGVSIKRDGRISSLYSHSDSDIGVGEKLAAVVNKLQQRDPETVRKFEELFFANMRPGVAIKYVGQEPLKPKSIEVLKDGKWVPA